MHQIAGMQKYICMCWVECVGIADRSAFDLSNHAKARNVDMKASEKFKTPTPMDFTKVKFNGKSMFYFFFNFEFIFRTKFC
eukprot:GSMAST32.ASY1.ANO1.608.1 assembled CDS